MIIVGTADWSLGRNKVLAITLEMRASEEEIWKHLDLISWSVIMFLGGFILLSVSAFIKGITYPIMCHTRLLKFHLTIYSRMYVPHDRYIGIFGV